MIKKIRKACEINDKVFSEVVRGLKNGSLKTEKAVYRFILKRFRDFGVGYSYKPIVANNVPEIHPTPRDKPLERGFLILDFGARVNGACSDMTRTLFLGKANKKEKSLYDKVLRCQEKCVAKIKSGVKCKELDEFSRKLLGNYRKYFTHSLGHGLGYRVHQKPKISPKSDKILEDGDFVTIEPGIYIAEKSLGIRIEDTVLVEKSGYKVLSKAPKNLIEIDSKLI